MHALFYTRLLLYMLAMSISVIHPSIVVPYDKVGWFLWFFLMPAEMFIAYYLSPPRFPLKVWIGSAAALLALFIVIFAPFNSYTLLVLGVGAGSFILTALIFRLGQRAETVFFLEQFFLVYLYYKLLSFSRASETVAARSSTVTQILLFVTIGAFLLHGIVLFLAAFPENRNMRGKRELVIFSLGVLPALLLIAFLLPPNFVNNSIVMNMLDREAESEPIPIDESGEAHQGNGNLRPLRPDEGQGDSGQEGEDGREGQNGKRQGKSDKSTLEGVPSDQWDPSAQGKGPNNQRAVMIVASAHDPVYSADEYRGTFDPELGFVRSADEPLNELPFLRFLDTWTDRNPPMDSFRNPVSVFYLSTRPDRLTAYRPSSIEPTVLTRKYHPFEFSYKTVSNISTLTEDTWSEVRELSDGEREELEPYLSLPLEPEVSRDFSTFLENALLTGEAERYGEKIDAILRSFSSHQYELGYQEDVTPERMRDFLVNDLRGDCTEFSNSAAILGRLAGIPSRVVTGYLASKGLQSNSHRRGIMMLRQSIEFLNEYPLDHLYLVTTAHRHSWTQFYIPGYGWVDFEPTTHAIPPPPGQDPNSAEVVIPLIQDQSGELARKIPWGLIFTTLGSVVAGSLVLLYVFRYSREGILFMVSRGEDARALSALSRLLLIRLAGARYPLKIPSETFAEYSVTHPELNRFSELHNRLRYRVEFPEGMKESLWQDIRTETQRLRQYWRKPGFWNLLVRILSLRGLYY